MMSDATDGSAVLHRTPELTPDTTEVLNSYGRCLLNDRFFDRFYDILVQSDAKLEALRSGGDRHPQVERLRHRLNMALLFVEGDELGRFVLSGAKSERNSTVLPDPQFSPHWLGSLLAAVAECDPKFRPNIARCWSDAMQPVVNYLRDD